MHYVAQPNGRSKKFLIRYEQDVDDASYNIMATRTFVRLLLYSISGRMMLGVLIKSNWWVR